MLYSLLVCLAQVSTQLVDFKCDDGNIVQVLRVTHTQKAFTKSSDFMHTMEWEGETIL